MRAGHWSLRRLSHRWLTAVVVGLLAAFGVASAPHHVHHLGQDSLPQDQCPVALLLQTLSGLLPPIPDLPLQAIIGWILLTGSLPLLPRAHPLSYRPRAPPALAFPLISR